MSRIFYLKDLCEEIYTESVATEHPDIAKQRIFAKKAEKILAARKIAREQSKNPKVKKAVEFFSKSEIKKVNEDITIEDANGKAFAEVIDLIKNTNIKFKGFSSVKEENTTDKLKDIKEATDGIGSRSKNYRLDRWFDDGGWVQTGGKYDGKPCAKQPGQKTKPYCRDPDDRAELTKDERNKRAAKKREEDSNPNRSGEAKVVTQESAGEKDACYTKVKSRYKIWPSAYASGALVKCRKVGADSWGTKTEAVNPAQQAAIAISMKEAGKKPKSKVKEEYIEEREMTSAETKKEKELKSKYDDSGMKASMIKQYGKEEGEKIYFATIRKQSMKDEVEYDDVYAYVIEMLVAAEFAENYEAAEVMFEHMSDEFTSAIVEEYIEERKISRTERKKQNAGKKGYNAQGNPIEPDREETNLVDLDANAMKPKKAGVEAEIEVKNGEQTVRKLTPQQFNDYKLKDGEEHKYTQFNSSSVFKKTLKGNKKVRNLHRGGESIGLTARGGMDNNREVLNHVRDSGFSKKHGVNLTGISFTGDVPGKNTDDKKMKVIKHIIKTKKPKIIKFSDDHAKNLDAPETFNREEGKDKTQNRGSSVPKIKTYLTRGDGRPVRYGSGGGGVRDSSNVNPPSSNQENQRRRKKAKRGMTNNSYNYFKSNCSYIQEYSTYQATKEEMTSYEYWKQFIN